MLVYIYYILLLLCFGVSLYFGQFRMVRLLTILLFLSIVVELFAELLKARGQNFFVYYHLFTIAEYLLITLILRESVPFGRLRNVMNYSIILFPLFALINGFFIEDFQHFPSIAHGVEGLLLICWSLWALWNLEASGNTSILRQPVFWFALAFLTYFAVSLVYNSVYKQLLFVRAPQARHLFTVVNSLSNYLLYIFIIIGILQYKWRKSI